MKPMGREVLEGIFAGIAAIVVCVAIGSFIAQNISFGHHKKKGSHAHGSKHADESGNTQKKNKDSSH